MTARRDHVECGDGISHPRQSDGAPGTWNYSEGSFRQSDGSLFRRDPRVATEGDFVATAECRPFDCRDDWLRALLDGFNDIRQCGIGQGFAELL